MSDLAYYTNEGFFSYDKGYQVAEVTRGEPGYTVAALCRTIEQAQAEVDRRNQDAGVTPDEAVLIVASSMAVTHHWQYGRMTGTKTCERCGLLPLDPDDVATPCPGTRDRTERCTFYLMPGMRCDGERYHAGNCFKTEV